MRIHVIAEKNYTREILKGAPMGDRYSCLFRYNISRDSFLKYRSGKITQYTIYNGNGALTGHEDPYDSSRTAATLPFIPVEINFSKVHE